MTPDNPYFSGDPSDSARGDASYSEDTPPSIAMIRAIAAIEDTDPVDAPADLGIRLADQFDPDALDRLFIDGDRRGEIRVTLWLYTDDRYHVSIRDGGQVIVWKPDE